MNRNPGKILACPDDGSALEPVSVGQNWAFYSESSALLYPVIDDIVVLLARQDRSYELEREAIKPFRKAEDAKIVEAAARTLELLDQRKGKRSFAWEDEVHWTEKYRAMSSAPNVADDRGWNDRLWQRKPFVDAAEVSEIKSVLDIGCGEGQNFRSLLKDRLAPECLYIAADISFEGLRLNRQRNAWKHALYLVCSADRLPLKPQSVDMICYFGILHHTERKAKNFPVHLNLLKPGGKIILHEAVERPRISSDNYRSHESAHEERFDVRDLEAEIKNHSETIHVRSWKMRHSIFWSAFARAFGPAPLQHPLSYKVINFIDHSCIRLLGPLIPWFRGGEVLALLERPSDSSQSSPAE